MQESGVPIDMVAGVSIGALFGALYCLENDLASATQKARQWSMVSLRGQQVPTRVLYIS